MPSNENIKALILVGGYGTRLEQITKGEIPKPMVFVAGKPFLEHIILFLRDQEITDIVLAVGHKSEAIKSYFGNGSNLSVNITYSEEDHSLGTAGAIKNAEKYIDDTFIVLNGDTYSQINLKDFLEFHKSKRSNFSIGLMNAEESIETGNVILNGSRVAEFSEKKKVGGKFVNRGIYIFEPEIFGYIEKDKKISLEEEIFPSLVENGQLYGFPCEGYFSEIGKPDTYNRFRRDVLNSLLLLEQKSVREAMEKITKNKIDLILVVNKEEILLGILNDRIIRNFLLKGGGLDDLSSQAMIPNPDRVATLTDDDKKISELLFPWTRHLPIVDENNKIKDVKFRAEEIQKQNFPVVRGKAPLRVSFAGGGTDFSDFFERYGGVVISGTIDKYCHATLVKRADSKIVINSDFEEETIISKESLIYDGKFDLIKSIVKIMDPPFGFNLYLNNDVPHGRGLGSSATLAVLIIKLIPYLQGKEYDDYKVAKLAYKAEVEELGIKGGWQDQYASVIGGFNFMEFEQDQNIVYPLRIKEETISELEANLTLCYTGDSHFSGNLQKNLEESFQGEKKDVIESCKELKKIAVKIKDSLLADDIEKMGGLLHSSWELKKISNEQVSNSKIDSLYEIGIKNGAKGGKLLGSGDGGYILFFNSPEKRKNLKNALEKAGGEILNFNFESKGAKIWIVKDKLFDIN